MGNLTITIERNNGVLDIRYSPTSRQVSRGGTVTFNLQNIPGEADVTFDSGSCLTAPGPYILNGASLLTSSYQETVDSNASVGPYPFTVTIPSGTERRKGEEREAKKGELDVTTEHPEDPKDKRK
jgi:hypothetical protein